MLTKESKPDTVVEWANQSYQPLITMTESDSKKRFHIIRDGSDFVLLQQVEGGVGFPTYWWPPEALNILQETVRYMAVKIEEPQEVKG